MNDAEGVKRLLRDAHKLRVRRYDAGDYDASVLLIDLDTAISNAKLTGRQREALDAVFERDLTQEDAANAMGVTRRTLREFVDVACNRIADVYKRWDYGEVTVELASEDGENNGRGTIDDV